MSITFIQLFRPEFARNFASNLICGHNHHAIADNKGVYYSRFKEQQELNAKDTEEHAGQMENPVTQPQYSFTMTHSTYLIISMSHHFIRYHTL